MSMEAIAPLKMIVRLFDTRRHDMLQIMLKMMVALYMHTYNTPTRHKLMPGS